MGAVLVVFAVSVTGQIGSMIMSFETQQDCEAKRSEVTYKVLQENKDTIEYIAAVCFTPQNVHLT